MVSGGYEWPVFRSRIRAVVRADLYIQIKIIKINKLMWFHVLSSTFFSDEWKEIWRERSALSDEWFQGFELLVATFLR